MRNIQLNSKAVSGIILALLIFCISNLAFNIQPVQASATVHIRADGSIDPPSASIETTDNVTYTFTGDINDSIVVERDNIVIEGMGHVLQGTGSDTGLDLSSRTNVTIKGLRTTDFMCSIGLNNSVNCLITENNITASSQAGVGLFASSGNSISGNHITATDEVGVYLYDCSGNSISGNHIAANYGHGVVLSGCSDNSISGNNITANYGDGVNLSYSYNNSISGNNMENNGEGVYLWSSHNNSLHHNNFIDNDFEVYSSGLPNIWDDGYPSGGNYWTDYGGFDSGHDGIGDTPYIIDENNTDDYPLMGRFYGLNTSLGKPVNIVSNSSIEGFEDEPDSTIRFYVSNSTPSQSVGFCRVAIPKSVLPPPYTVVIDDGATEVLYYHGLLEDNGTHRWIYFEYEHSQHKIEIIPEFPSLLILPFLMVAGILIVMAHRRKANITLQTR